MNQKSPLLNYRIKCDNTESILDVGMNYDMTLGLWIDDAGEPIIKKYTSQNELNAMAGETLITKTREGIDRSEGSNIRFDKKVIKSFDETIVTATREGIDRSENCFSDTLNAHNVNDDNKIIDLISETTLTRSREGIDRAESSYNNSQLAFQSVQTFTRESIDRSEKSS